MEALVVTSAMARVDLTQGEVTALLGVVREAIRRAPASEDTARLQSLEAGLADVARDDYPYGRGADVDAKTVETREDLSAFVEAMLSDLLAHPGQWENHTLPAFLEALSAYIAAVAQNYRNRGLPFPDPPTWHLFAYILRGATLYE